MFITGFYFVALTEKKDTDPPWGLPARGGGVLHNQGYGDISPHQRNHIENVKIKNVPFNGKNS